MEGRTISAEKFPIWIAENEEGDLIVSLDDLVAGLKEQSALKTTGAAVVGVLVASIRFQSFFAADSGSSDRTVEVSRAIARNATAE